MPNGIANIISMHKLEKLYRISYDSWEGYYIVHTAQGKVYFQKDEQGLPYTDLEQSGRMAAIMPMQNASQQSTEPEGVALVQTVRENYEGYTKRELLRAKEACRAQAMIGNQSKGDFKGMVSSNMIKNCSRTPSDIANAKEIFGPALVSVRGKAVRRTPAPAVGDYVAVPRPLVERNRIITMAADVFFVDGTAFLITLSRNVKFITAEHTPVRTARALVKHIERVLQVYRRAGFIVRTVLMDGDLKKIKDVLPTVECNTTVAKEHVSEAERTIRTVKERTRGLVCTLPFTHIPRQMKIEFIYFMVFWLNAFPVKTGFSGVYSPRELLVQWRLDYNKHCRVLPGT